MFGKIPDLRAARDYHNGFTTSDTRNHLVPNESPGERHRMQLPNPSARISEGAAMVREQFDAGKFPAQLRPCFGERT